MSEQNVFENLSFFIEQSIVEELHSTVEDILLGKFAAVLIPSSQK